MAKDNGYWFTTDTGVHIHVEPGETKEQAMKRKFGAGSKTVNARKYEPEEGFEAERAHTKVYDMTPWEKNKSEKAYGYETVYREVKYNGEWGEYNEMLAKYGMTETQAKKSGISEKYLDAKYFGTNENSVNQFYQQSRRKEGAWMDAITSKHDPNYKKPTYSQTFYNEKGKKIGSWDTTGKSTGNPKLQSYELFLNKNNKKK